MVHRTTWPVLLLVSSQRFPTVDRQFVSCGKLHPVYDLQDVLARQKAHWEAPLHEWVEVSASGNGNTIRAGAVLSGSMRYKQLLVSLPYQVFVAWIPRLLPWQVSDVAGFRTCKDFHEHSELSTRRGSQRHTNT